MPSRLDPMVVPCALSAAAGGGVPALNVTVQASTLSDAVGVHGRKDDCECEKGPRAVGGSSSSCCRSSFRTRWLS